MHAQCVLQHLLQKYCVIYICLCCRSSVYCTVQRMKLPVSVVYSWDMACLFIAQYSLQHCNSMTLCVHCLFFYWSYTTVFPVSEVYVVWLFFESKQSVLFCPAWLLQTDRIVWRLVDSVTYWILLSLLLSVHPLNWSTAM